MPSNKYPDVVAPGTGLPVSTAASASAIGDALKAHINDAVGAHAASAISTVDGPTWLDGVTNPAADAQIQLDKIIDDLSAITVPSGAHHVGAAANAASFTNAPYSLAADEVYAQLSDLLLFANTPYRTVLLDAGTTTYTLTAAPRVTQILVDSTTGTRTLVLPTTPADHKGWTWHVYDVSGTSANTNIAIDRAALATYTINGYAGNLAVGKKHGQWVVTCDGTNFYVQEINRSSIPVLVSGGNSPYTVDSTGAHNDLVLVRTTAARTIIFPAASGCKGRVWRIVDVFGSSHIYPITLQPTGGDAINSYAGSIDVGKSFGEWIVTCDGTDLFVQEMSAPTMQPQLVTSSPFDLDAGALQYDDVYVDATGGNRNLVLPQYPASHKNQKWHIYDVSTAGSTNSIDLQRYGGATYTINGVAADHLLKPASTAKDFGHWVVICDGTSFFVHEVPPRTGGIDWANTWSQTNTFSNISPIDFNYAGDVTVTKSTAGFLEFYTLGDFRVRPSGSPIRVRFREFTRDWVSFTQNTAGSGSRYVDVAMGYEGPGAASPFASNANPNSINILPTSTNSPHGLEIMGKMGGDQATYLRLWAGGGADQASAERGHLILEMNNNEGRRENVTYLPMKSALLKDGGATYEMETNIGGNRSEGRTLQGTTDINSICLIEAHIFGMGVNSTSGVPTGGFGYWKRVARGTRSTAGTYAITTGAPYSTQNVTDHNILSGTDIGVVLRVSATPSNGFVVEIDPGANVSPAINQLYWGYMVIHAFTWIGDNPDYIEP